MHLRCLLQFSILCQGSWIDFFLIPTFSIIFIHQVNLNNASHSWWTSWVMNWCCSSANCLPHPGFHPEHQINTHAYISRTQQVKAWRSETQLSLTLSGPAWAKWGRPCLKKKTRSKETNKKLTLSTYGFLFSFVYSYLLRSHGWLLILMVWLAK